MRLRDLPKSKSVSGSPSSFFYSDTVRTNLARLLWVVLVIWGEAGVFFWSLSTCKWPVIQDTIEDSPARATHVLLVSDPQVQHRSLFLKGSRWSGPLRQFVFDLHLRKSWHVTRRLNPDAVIFLGDMLANGKSARNGKEFQQAAQKFKSIFTLDSNTGVHYIPGNNDVGMGMFKPPSSHVREYYENAFGPLNQYFTISNHTFVGLDAPGLVDEDYQRTARGTTFNKWRPLPNGTVLFVKQLPTDVARPIILLSHIPLSRPDTATCGPLREKGSIQRGVGYGYQNTLGKQTTAFLLNTLQPSAVFSGDNRDYCEYTHALSHPTTPHSVREVTVKSFSMSVHIRKPGFQLLSLVDSVSPNTRKSFVDAPCTLPSQYGIYTSLYLPFLFITMVVILAFNIYRSRLAKQRPESIFLSRSSSHSPPSSIYVPTPDSAQWSPTWSPYTPGILSSSHNSIPSMRSAQAAAGPMFRASASRPDTPLGSPLLSPAIYAEHDDDEESMFPSQYSPRPHKNDVEWSSSREELEDILHDGASHSLLSDAIPMSDRARPAWRVHNPGWSWTFVFRGRVRRITLPSWRSCLELGPLLSFMDLDEGFMRRRGVLRNTLLDSISILWPAVLVGCITTWMML